jgi:hypothetical protein
MCASLGAAIKLKMMSSDFSQAGVQNWNVVFDCRFQASLFRGLSAGGRRETGIELASKAGSFRFYFFELPLG